MRIALSAAAVSALAIGTLAVAGTASAATQTLRPDDVDTSETRSAGHVEFTADGLDVYTDDASSEAKAAALWSHAGSIPDVVELSWRGTQPQPGTNIVFDTDSVRSNAGSFNTLVGEPVYGDRYWMTGGAARAAERGIVCPSTEGGNGSDCHGTLAEWQTALPAAEVYAVGFSLGSGVQGSGTIRSLSVDDTVYRFTGVPVSTPVVPRVHSSKWKDERRNVAVIRFGTDPVGANQTLERKVAFKVMVDGRTVARSRVGFDAEQTFRRKFAKHTGAHVVWLSADNQLEKVLIVHTGWR